MFPYIKIYKGWSFAERHGEGSVRIFYSCAYSWQQVDQFLAQTQYFWNVDCMDGFLMGMKEWRTEWMILLNLYSEGLTGWKLMRAIELSFKAGITSL